MKALLLVAVVVLAFTCIVTGQQGSINCQNTFNGKFYDLWPLNQKLNGQVQEAISQEQSYFFLPCGTVSGKVSQCTFSYDSTPAVCQKDNRSPPQWHGCGTADVGLGGVPVWEQGNVPTGTEGFRLNYNKKGETDPEYPNPRNTTIDFFCDPTQDPGQLVGASNPESPAHSYHLEWRTKYACAVAPPPDNGGGDDKGGISVGWILIIIFFGVLVLYFAIGALVCKFALKKEGIEIIPNHGFWLALPGLVKDGNLFVVRKAMGLCNRGGGYSNV